MFNFVYLSNPWEKKTEKIKYGHPAVIICKAELVSRCYCIALCFFDCFILKKKIIKCA